MTEMFTGTIDKRDYKRIIQLEIKEFRNFVLPQNNKKVFAMAIFKNGKVLVEIDGESFIIEAPAIFCISDNRHIKVANNGAQGELLFFNPTFININMSIETIRNPNYDSLCEYHSFFQLQPFLELNPDKNIIKISEKTLEKLIELIEFCKHELDYQNDWYWSCRARSYFMDIIRVVENIYHNYGINTDEVREQKSLKVSKELKEILEYIDNNLESELVLEETCNIFNTYRKRIEKMFHDYLNVTYYEYIKAERLKKTCYYLRFTELSLKEIAMRVGFSSSQNLAKFFKKQNGIAMNQFRKISVLNRKVDESLKNRIS